MAKYFPAALLVSLIAIWIITLYTCIDLASPHSAQNGTAVLATPSGPAIISNRADDCDIYGRDLYSKEKRTLCNVMKLRREVGELRRLVSDLKKQSKGA